MTDVKRSSNSAALYGLLCLFCLAVPGSGQDIDALIRNDDEWPNQTLKLLEQTRYREAKPLLKGVIPAGSGHDGAGAWNG